MSHRFPVRTIHGQHRIEYSKGDDTSTSCIDRARTGARVRARRAKTIAVLAFLLLSTATAPASDRSDAATTAPAARVGLVSAAADGTPADRDSGSPAWSPGGRQVAFTSSASNLVANDRSDKDDVFVKDLGRGGVTLVSRRGGVLSAGLRAEGPVWSPDGSQIAFIAAATRAGPEGEELRVKSSVYVWSARSGRIRLVSTTSGGRPVPASALSPAWSPNGKALAFVIDDRSGRDNTSRIYLKNLASGALTDVSKGTRGSSGPPVWSPDGRWIAYAAFLPERGYQLVAVKVKASALRIVGSGESPIWDQASRRIAFTSAFDIVPDDRNGHRDVFVKDIFTGVVRLVSTTQRGVQGNDESVVRGEWSPDGRWVTFDSLASNFGVRARKQQVWAKDIRSGRLRLLSANQAGAPGNDNSQFGGWSADMMWFAFESWSSNLVSSNGRRVRSVFLKSLRDGRVLMVNRPRTADAAGEAWGTVWSPKGHRLAFVSNDPNLLDSGSGQPVMQIYVFNAD